MESLHARGRRRCIVDLDRPIFPPDKVKYVAVAAVMLRPRSRYHEGGYTRIGPLSTRPLHMGCAAVADPLERTRYPETRVRVSWCGGMCGVWYGGGGRG